MTRKRYVKLLMACGFSRNSAAQAARCVRDQLCGGGVLPSGRVVMDDGLANDGALLEACIG